jgi:hypothetical protein
MVNGIDQPEPVLLHLEQQVDLAHLFPIPVESFGDASEKVVMPRELGRIKKPFRPALGVRRAFADEQDPQSSWSEAVTKFVVPRLH